MTKKKMKDKSEEKVVANPAFREYVMSNAFVLTLSANQIGVLAAAVESGTDGYRLSGLVVSSLMRRGLIEIGHAKETKINGKVVATYIMYVPTLAGRLVYRLLLEAGLVYSPDHPMVVCPIDCTQEEWATAEG